MASDQEQQSRLKVLIDRGKEQGYLTYAELNDHLPHDVVDSEQIEEIISMINDMGILVYEVAPDEEFCEFISSASRIEYAAPLSKISEHGHLTRT